MRRNYPEIGYIKYYTFEVNICSIGARERGYSKMF